MTGSERLAWNQEAPGAPEIARYTYGAYVDGARVALAGHACSSWRTASGYACSAPLPPLLPGPHIIELVALVIVDGHALESPRSAPLHVTRITNSTTTAAALPDAGQGTRTFAVDGIEYRVETVLQGLTSPVALAFVPDGRLMVAERSGTVRVFDGRTGAVRVALGPDDLPSAGPVTVHALVLHPDFRVNRLVFLLYTTPDTSGAVMRLTRLREIGDTLGEAVVLLDGVPSSGADATGALSFGRDGKLYVATNDADQPLLADDIGAFSGKVLRLNEDGTTPDDSGAHTPVFAGGVHQPVGIGALGALSRNGGSWLVDRSDTSARRSGGVSADYVTRLSRSGAAGATVYRGSRLPAFTNALFVTSATENRIDWFVIDPATREWLRKGDLLAGWFGSLHAIGEGSDGCLYVGTGHRPTGSGRDVVVRIAPVSRAQVP